MLRAVPLPFYNSNPTYTNRSVWGGDLEEAARKVHDFFDSPAFKDGVSHVVIPPFPSNYVWDDAFFFFPAPKAIAALFLVSRLSSCRAPSMPLPSSANILSW